MMREKPPVLERPVRQDFICYKGQSWCIPLYFEHADNTVYDITGWTAKAEIRPEPNSETLTAEIHTGVIGVDGEIALALTPEETAQLWEGAYYWDIYTIRPNGKKEVWFYGKFFVKGRVTV